MITGSNKKGQPESLSVFFIFLSPFPSDSSQTPAQDQMKIVCLSSFFAFPSYDLLKNQLARLLLELLASFWLMVWMVGMVGGASPPPPRRGLAMRLPAEAKLKPPGELRPRVLPALAASRRSLTAASWTSNLCHG